MIIENIVVQYPTVMPSDDTFGGDEDYYNKYYRNSYMRIGMEGYPEAVKNIQQATWFTTQGAARSYLAMFPKQEKYLALARLRVEVG